jgi:transposase, IS6 family
LRGVDQGGQVVDFRLTARRDIKAARAFLKQACENARPYQLRSITTDKAHSYARVISEMNRFERPNEGILLINRKWENNRIESDHAALKKPITPIRGFKSLSSAKVTLRWIEAIRTITHGHVHGKQPGVTGDIRFVESLFGLAA